MKSAPEIAVIEERERAAALLEPTRLRLLTRLRAPGSGAALARELDLPRQRVNYHLRELEKAGLVELVEERRKGNCVERVVRATAASYLVGPSALGDLAADPETAGDRFSWSHLVALAARTIRELASLRRRADRAKQRLPTLGIDTAVRFASPESQRAFTEELTEAIATIVERYHDPESPDGRAFRLFVGSHPLPASDAPASDEAPETPTETETETEARPETRNETETEEERT